MSKYSLNDLTSHESQFPHMQTEDCTYESPKVVVRSNDHTFKQHCSWHPINFHQIIDAGIIMVLVALVIFLMIWLSYPHVMNCFILISQLLSLPLDTCHHLIILGPTVVERSWSIWPFPSLPSLTLPPFRFLCPLAQRISFTPSNSSKCTVFLSCTGLFTSCFKHCFTHWSSPDFFPIHFSTHPPTFPLLELACVFVHYLDCALS